MINIKAFVLVIYLFVVHGYSLVASGYENVLKPVPFKEAMLLDKNSALFNLMLRHDNSVAMINFYEKLYNNINVLPADKPIIPLKIHQVWIGGEKMPELYESYIATCRKLHPHWEYKLWTEKEIQQELILDKKYTDLLDLFRNWFRHGIKEFLIKLRGML